MPRDRVGHLDAHRALAGDGRHPDRGRPHGDRQVVRQRDDPARLHAGRRAPPRTGSPPARWCARRSAFHLERPQRVEQRLPQPVELGLAGVDVLSGGAVSSSIGGSIGLLYPPRAAAPGLLGLPLLRAFLAGPSGALAGRRLDAVSGFASASAPTRLAPPSPGPPAPAARLAALARRPPRRRSTGAVGSPRLQPPQRMPGERRQGQRRQGEEARAAPRRRRRPWPRSSRRRSPATPRPPARREAALRDGGSRSVWRTRVSTPTT